MKDADASRAAPKNSKTPALVYPGVISFGETYNESGDRRHLQDEPVGRAVQRPDHADAKNPKGHHALNILD